MLHGRQGTRHAALGGAAADVEALTRIAGTNNNNGTNNGAGNGNNGDASNGSNSKDGALLPGCDAAQSARVRALAGRALGLAVQLGRGDVVRALVARAGAPVSPGALEARRTHENTKLYFFHEIFRIFHVLLSAKKCCLCFQNILILFSK